MFERAFVIVPLLEINQDIKQNISRSQVEEMKRREGVTVWKQKMGKTHSCFRKLKGYTQEGFAKELGVSVSVLGEVERESIAFPRFCSGSC